MLKPRHRPSTAAASVLAAIALASDGAALSASVPAAPSPREGIGLALARRLVDEAGGTLTAGSEADRASFTATLPGPASGLRSA